MRFNNNFDYNQYKPFRGGNNWRRNISSNIYNYGNNFGNNYGNNYGHNYNFGNNNIQNENIFGMPGI